MKKLMKIFEIKKKSPMERQNLFREIVNGICELEVLDDVGKVLVLKEGEEGGKSNGYHDDDETEEDLRVPTAEELGYGDAAPATSRDDRDERFRISKTKTTSGNLSVCTANSFGEYVDEGSQKKPVRKQGYKRRGSVTRYSIVAQNAVVDEYKKHADVIEQFRKDSAQIETSMRKLSVGGSGEGSGSSGGGSGGGRGDRRGSTAGGSRDRRGSAAGGSRDEIDGAAMQRPRQRGRGRGGGRQQQQQQVDGEGNAVQRFFRRGRISLAF